MANGVALARGIEKLMLVKSTKLFSAVRCKLLVLTILLMLISQSHVMSQESTRPITKVNLLSSLKLGGREGKTAAWYVKLIKENGVNFRLMPADEKRIREVGKYLGDNGVAVLVAAIRSSYKMLILVSKFQSLENKNFPAGMEIILTQLKRATQEYSDTMIEYSDVPITAQQGDDFARRKGQELGASFVIWGWYSSSRSNIFANVHFVFVKGLQSWTPCTKSEEETFNSSLDESDRYQLQTKISEHMTYLTLFIGGLSRLEARDAKAAIEKFDQALQYHDTPEQMIDPAQIYHSRARAFVVAGDYDRAIADWDKVIAIAPIALGYQSRGIAHEQKGLHDLALKDFTQAITLDPKSPTGYYDRGVVYGNLEKDDLAILDYSKVISLDSKFTDAYFNRALAYERQGKHDLAISDLNSVIELMPDHVCGHIRRGMIYYERKSYDAALNDLSYVLVNHADFERSFALYAIRALIYEKKGKYDLAIADYDRLVILDPTRSAYFLRAGALSDIGKYDRAIADLTQAVKLDPKFLEGYLSRGRLYQEVSKYDLAIADFDHVTLVQPENVDAYFGRALVYFILDKNELAISDFTRTIQLDPDHSRAYFGRGVAYVATHDSAKAILDFNKVLRLSTDPELRRQTEDQLKRITVK